jgi:hypothetical protein
LFAHDLGTKGAERIKNIDESKHFPVDLLGVVAEPNLLNINEKERLHRLLAKFSQLFNGTLANWRTTPVESDVSLLRTLRNKSKLISQETC